MLKLSHMIIKKLQPLQVLSFLGFLEAFIDFLACLDILLFNWLFDTQVIPLNVDKIYIEPR